MNEIALYGSVGASWWGEDYFTAKQVRDQLDGVDGPVTVRINSGGGVATEGQAIYTLLVDHPHEVHVVIEGVAASAASLIAMAGDTITMRLGAWMLVHDPAQPYVEGRGTEGDHRKLAEQLRVLSNAYAEIYAKRTKQTVDDVRDLMRAETVMDGSAAIALGFATDKDEAEAEAAAKFDYRMYSHAPADLRAASDGLGVQPGRQAMMAIFAGQALPGVTPTKEKPMAKRITVDPAEEVSATETAAQTVEVEPGETEEPQVVAQAVTIRERTRVRRIIDACALAGLAQSVADDMIDRGLSEAVALDEILKKRLEGHDMNEPISRGPAAIVTADARDKFKAGAELSLMAKAGLGGGERNEFSSMSLSELARASIEITGERVSMASRLDIVGRAFTMSGMHSTSDFGNILSNVAGKAALKGWDEAEETYDRWTSKGTLTDFKETKRVGAGLHDALLRVEEGAEYKRGTIGDRGESISLATYGNLLTISRQAIINDDLDILGKLPMRMGRAARRTVGNLVYAVLTGNPALSDGKALFHADHKNLGTAAAPSVASLGAAKSAMRLQKEKAGGPSLNIAPRYIIVPSALEVAVSQLLNSTVDPTTSKGHASNPVAGMAEMIVDGRLDDASATAWYLAANPAAYDTIEVAYLDGNDAPYLEQQDMWTVDGVSLKVRIDAGVAPLDFRTLYKNAGA